MGHAEKRLCPVSYTEAVERLYLLKAHREGLDRNHFVRVLQKPFVQIWANGVRAFSRR